MIRVYRDATYAGVYIDGIPRIFPARALIPQLSDDGTTIWIFLGATANSLVTTPWSNIADVNGGTFGDAPSALAYLRNQCEALPVIELVAPADGALDIALGSPWIELRINGLPASPSEYTVAANVLHVPATLQLIAGDIITVIQG